MSINHHLLAKTTTDSILANFKSGAWQCCVNIGVNFFRVGCDSSFPSPDAAFYEDVEKLLVSFEFKPPTETKRGILTGLGQSIAYLNNSNLSYLIIPQKLDDFEIGQFMTDLYANQIVNNLPIGLILYENNNPASVSLIHNIDAVDKTRQFKSVSTSRFWAKHQDLPIPLFHLILHCYYLKRIGQISEDAFAYCWKKYLVPDSIFNTLQSVDVLDLNGQIIKTVAGKKPIHFFEKKLAPVRKLTGQAKASEIRKLKYDADTNIVGDNNYNSIKKNFITFLKHIGSIDSTGNLTDDGFRLYHLGLSNGANSKLFKDYFTRTVLLTGNHLDLIFDLDNLCNQSKGKKTFNEIKGILLDEYEMKGMIKRNPSRKSGNVEADNFFKYEFILWNALDLIVKTNGLPEKSFNWKRVTEICSLPEL
jgi:hypothetical protein